MWITYIHIVLVIWNSCCTSVTGSSQVVLAKVGDDVILPCDIKPPVNVAEGTVQWSRPDLTPDYVHLLQDGHVKSDVLNPLYKQRTSLFVELPRGNISLKLSRVQLEDNGTFKCFFPTLDSSTLVQLIVETDKLGAGAIAGIVIAANIFLVVAAVLVGYFYWKKKKQTIKEKYSLKYSKDDQGNANVTELLVPEPSTQTAASSDLQKEVSDLKAKNTALQEEVSNLKEENSEMKLLMVHPSTQPPASSALNDVQIDGPDQLNADLPMEVKVYEETYELKSEPTCLCLVVCTNTFVSKTERRTTVESDQVAHTFSGLGFRVLKCKDQTKTQMRNILESLSSLKNLTELQESNIQEWSRKDDKFTEHHFKEDPLQHGHAFVCCICCRGSGVIVGTDGEHLRTDDIITMFNRENCPNLAHKPKVFFIDSCHSKKTHNEDHLLVAGGTKEERTGNVCVTRGSWFLASVCKQMEEGCDRGDEIQTILSKVIMEVSKKPGGNGQTPEVIINNLKKNLVFSQIHN